MSWWQEIPYRIDPIIVEFGSLQIRYYGMMYLVALATVYALVRYRLQREEYPYTNQAVEDVLIWGMLGMIIGARLGDALFYNFSYFALRPWEIFLPFTWENGALRFVGFSGMSYHGGFIGAFVAFFLYCRAQKIAFLHFADLFIPAIPLGYTFGRIGNFINGELFGRETTVSWGMYFPLDPSMTLRHPSQLYEAFFEGIFLFIILWLLRTKIKTAGALLALYIIGYGAVRFFIEFFREPETGFIAGPLTMGQLLCLLMIFVGAILLTYLTRRKSGDVN
ncbi:MAG: prolipoprotein diacylglyceryl transferase [Deltaproteobacteria bacterium]|nr:prolipoprotein diacylglyceryl transferase [Deltaproteobacteria bacterium]